MLQEIDQAINDQDYQTARELLEKLEEKEANNPWIQLYQGRLQEAEGKLVKAEQSYRQILLNTINSKIISQARQGLERLAQTEKTQQQEALSSALEEDGSQELGVLILEPIAAENKKELAQKFAKIMNIDAYSARLKLPSRSWRLYRSGHMGELRFYSQALLQVNIPCFAISLPALNQINVYQVSYFDSFSPQVNVICSGVNGDADNFCFNWEEVTQKVEALLPIFELTLETDIKGKMYRKTKTLDYAKICDLHLLGRKTILRFCDYTYNFHQGIVLGEGTKTDTNQKNWQKLQHCIQENLPNIRVWSDFTPFAENALDFKEILKHISPQINLFRREETPWDAALELYSSLVYLKSENERE